MRIGENIIHFVGLGVIRVVMQIGSKEGVIVPDLVVHSGRVEISREQSASRRRRKIPLFASDRCSIRRGDTTQATR